MVNVKTVRHTNIMMNQDDNVCKTFATLFNSYSSTVHARLVKTIPIKIRLVKVVPLTLALTISISCKSTASVKNVP